MSHDKYGFVYDDKGSKQLVFDPEGSARTLIGFSDRRISPRNMEQSLYTDSLLRKQFSAVVCVGMSGSGKSLLALAAGMELLEDQESPIDQIVLTKPFYRVGNSDAMGTLPGDADEKMQPYLQHFKPLLKKVGWDGSYACSKRRRSTVIYEPIEFMRGKTYENSFIFVDEAQSLTWTEIYTIVSRTGEGSKIVLAGDLNQIDSGIPFHKSGLYVLQHSEVFGKADFVVSHHLKKCIRSRLAELSNQVHLEHITRKDGKQT